MKTEKKLQRSSKNYMLMGVCGGLAEYLEVEATMVRLVFVLMGLWGGGGLLIYLILALIMPKDEEKSEVVVGGFGGRLGYFLILAGVAVVVNRFVPIRIESEWFWPALLVGVGAWMVMRK